MHIYSHLHLYNEFCATMTLISSLNQQMFAKPVGKGKTNCQLALIIDEFILIKSEVISFIT